MWQYMHIKKNEAVFAWIFRSSHPYLTSRQMCLIEEKAREMSEV